MENHRTRFALTLLAYAVQRGIPAKELCRLSDIDLEALKKSKGNISEKQISGLWLNAGRLANDPLFGLHFGESLQLAAIGTVGEIIKTSRTIGEAVTHACAIVGFVTDLFTMEVSRERQTFRMRFLPTAAAGADPAMARQMADFLMVFAVHELDGLILEKIQPVAVRFPYKTDSAEYARVLRCVPSRKSEYSLDFPKKYWDEHILTADHDMQTLLLQKVFSEPAPDLRKVPTVSQRVTGYLMANSYLGILSLDEVASNFHVSPRGLQRQLQEEHATFKELADDVRMTLALHYMKAGSHRVKEVAVMLGYNEISAFTRAFKRWTGKSPAHYAP